jgi:hypothetical protein
MKKNRVEKIEIAGCASLRNPFPSLFIFNKKKRFENSTHIIIIIQSVYCSHRSRRQRRGRRASLNSAMQRYNAKHEDIWPEKKKQETEKSAKK